MLIFENHNPTDTEIELFRYAGFYRIENDEQHIRYVPVHTKTAVKPFPDILGVEEKDVEYEVSITFYHTSETIEAVGDFDGRLLNLMAARMEELGWKI